MRDLFEMLRQWTGHGGPRPRKVTPEMRGPMNPTMTSAPNGGLMVDPASVQAQTPEPEPVDVLGGLAQVQAMQQALAPPPQQPPQLMGQPTPFQPFGEGLLKSRRRGFGGLAQ